MINKKKLLLVARRCSYVASRHHDFLKELGKIIPVDDFPNGEYPDWFVDMIDYGLSTPTMDDIERLLKEMKNGD